MDYQEIAFTTLLHSDVNTIHRLCYTNKTYKNICDTKYFWKHYFLNHKLPYPKEEFGDAQDWLDEIDHVVSCINTTAKILIYINKPPEDEDDDEWIFQIPAEELDINNVLIGNKKKDKEIIDFITENINMADSPRQFWFLVWKRNDKYGLTVRLVFDFSIYEDANPQFPYGYSERIFIDNIPYDTIKTYIYNMCYNHVYNVSSDVYHGYTS